MVLDSNKASYSIKSNGNDRQSNPAPRRPEDCFRNTLTLARSGEKRPSAAESTKESTQEVKAKIACLPSPPYLHCVALDGGD
jgi:hypothetical protein